MGKAPRFQDNVQSPQPGPAKYLIEGFTDKLLRENKKKNLAKLKKKKKSNADSSQVQENVDVDMEEQNDVDVEQ